MRKLAAILLTVFISIGWQPARAEQLNWQQEERIKELALEAILENPEIVEEAIDRLRQLQMEREQRAIAETIKKRRQEFERDDNAPVLGNPDGDVTVVEFFDYNCPYCKKAAKPVELLLAGDKSLRLVYREWPILGPGSVFAARAALAARRQGKYADIHKALMASGRVDEKQTLAVAAKLGLDIQQLKRDMSAPELDEHINLSMDLANSLKMNGTPTFLIGDQIVPGLVPLSELQAMVKRTRAAKL